MTAPTRTWSNPLAIRVEPQGIAVSKSTADVYVFPSSAAHVKKTSDVGATWTDLANSPSIAWEAGFVTSTGRVLGFPSSGSLIYYSDDNGTTWGTITAPYTTYWIECCDQNTDGAIYIGHYIGHIYKSTDNGNTWTDATGNLPTSGVTPSCIRHTSTGTLWISDGSSTSSDNGNMYYSTNNGVSWASSGYSGYSYTQFILSGSRYYAPIYNTKYVFNGTTGSYTVASSLPSSAGWWGCFPDNDGRYYVTNYAGQVYSSTDMSSFTLAYTNSADLFGGIVDINDNIWIAGSSNIVLGSVPAVSAKQLYIYSGGAWKPVTSTYVGVGGVWRLATPYGGIGGVWK
jgi:hypothetical protein